MSEQDLVRACLEYLQMKHIFAWRNSTGAFKKDNGALYRFGAVGSPDIFAVLEPHGQLLNIECKIKPGKQSPAQKVWELTVIAHGARYCLIYNIEDLIKYLKDL